jgi:hypothetical protein
MRCGTLVGMAIDAQGCSEDLGRGFQRLKIHETEADFTPASVTPR